MLDSKLLESHIGMNNLNGTNATVLNNGFGIQEVCVFVNILTVDPAQRGEIHSLRIKANINLEIEAMDDYLIIFTTWNVSQTNKPGRALLLKHTRSASMVRSACFECRFVRIITKFRPERLISQPGYGR